MLDNPIASAALVGQVGTSLSALLIAAFVWTLVTYLRGPHDLGQAFREGDRWTPATAWRGKIFVGLGFIRISYAYLVERTGDGSPILYLFAFGGCVLVIAGLVDGLGHINRSAE